MKFLALSPDLNQLSHHVEACTSVPQFPRTAQCCCVYLCFLESSVSCLECNVSTMSPTWVLDWEMHLCSAERNMNFYLFLYFIYFCTQFWLSTACLLPNLLSSSSRGLFSPFFSLFVNACRYKTKTHLGQIGKSYLSKTLKLSPPWTMSEYVKCHALNFTWYPYVNSNQVTSSNLM